MRKFIKRITIVFVAPCIMLLGAWYMLLTYSHWENIGILNFQVEKLKKFKDKHFKIIFIGDSSGGNAIETDDKTCINLCLSGSFGFEGSTSFIKVIDRYITYDTIVVINTIDVSTRAVSDEAKWLPNIYAPNLADRCVALKNSLLFLKPVLKNWISYLTQPLPTYLVADNDYPATNRRINKTRNEFDTKINPEEVAELKKLDNLLREKHAPYFLLYGPSLPFNETYLSELNKIIITNGIRHFLNQPFPLTEENKGDSEDHVHPTHAQYSTAYYLGLIRGTYASTPVQ
jgi:hypothetical protein